MKRSDLDDLLDFWEDAIEQLPGLSPESFLQDRQQSIDPDLHDAFIQNARSLAALNQRMAGLDAEGESTDSRGDAIKKVVGQKAIAAANWAGGALLIAKGRVGLSKRRFGRNRQSAVRPDPGLELVPGYRLVERLGVGGFGEV